MFLLSHTPKICIFHDTFQMLGCGQNCKFCHFEPLGRNIVTSLMKLQLTSFFSTHWADVHSILYQPVSFQKLFRILQNGAIYCTFFDLLCTFCTYLITHCDLGQRKISHNQGALWDMCKIPIVSHFCSNCFILVWELVLGQKQLIIVLL